MGILEANFEFVLNKATNCFFAELCTEDKKMVIQYDPGASQTAISALFLNKEKEAEYSPAYASIIENKLLERASKILGRPITTEEQSNLVKSFKSATGERIYGFLADMGNVKIGDDNRKIALEHFYYYYVPNNNTAMSLLGNDFINKCEFTHAFDGNIIVQRFNEDGYYREHENAITNSELNSLIEDISIDDIPHRLVEQG